MDIDACYMCQVDTIINYLKLSCLSGELFLFFMKNLENKAYLTMLEISFFIFLCFF